jgi:L-gulonolactone oxidase
MTAGLPAARSFLLAPPHSPRHGRARWRCYTGSQGERLLMNTAAVARRRAFVQSPPAAGTTQTVRPSSASEIAAILRDPKRYRGPVRPVGSASAATRCISASGGTSLEMTAMNRVLKIDEDTVTVQPGITLSELADVLSERNLELIGGFDLADRTVGGAICGAGLEPSMLGDASQFAAHAVQLKVVTAQGRRFVVDESAKSLLGLLRLSYGLLGVVYEVTLRVRPVQGFAVQSAKSSIRAFAKLDTRLAGSGSGLKLYLLPFRDKVWFELRQPAAEGDPGKRFAWRFRDWTANTALPDAVRSIARAVPFPRLRYPLIDSLGELAQSLMNNKMMRAGSHAVEQSGRVRVLGGRARLNYSTWGFPANEFGNIALAYKLFCREHYARTEFRCDMPTVGFRLTQDKSALLSPSFDGPVITLTALSTQPDGWEDFALDFAEFAQHHGGIAFFNQTKNADPAHVAGTFGHRLTFFRKIRRELDPHDRLLNQYFATYMQ